MDNPDDINTTHVDLDSSVEVSQGHRSDNVASAGNVETDANLHDPGAGASVSSDISEGTHGADDEEFVTVVANHSSSSGESFHTPASGSNTDNEDILDLPAEIVPEHPYVGVALEHPHVEVAQDHPAVEVAPALIPLPMELEVDVEEESDDEWFLVEPRQNQHMAQLMDAIYGQADLPISDDSSSNSENEDNAAARIVTFDQAAAGAHTYLGDDLEDIHGRIIFDEGSIVTLPALLQPNVVLIPGQTMPMHLSNGTMGAIMRTAVEQQKTVAILHYKATRSTRRASIAEVGTTAEVLSINNVTDSLLESVRAITKGRQRFRLLEAKELTGGILTAKIEILPELMFSDALEGAIPPSHYRPRAKYPAVLSLAHLHTVNPKSSSQSKKRRVHNQCSYFAHWPSWVYSQYSPTVLMERLKEEIRQWGDRTFAIMNRISCPDRLAYWLADNIPMSTENKLQILALRSSIQRLRYELHLIQKYKSLSCRRCESLVAKKSDIFSMSLEGPMGTYVNPYGSIHETLTVYKAKNLSLQGRPSKEFSWFPGYAWTIVNCRVCGAHKGWRFTSASLQPPMFYGLTRNGLVPGIRPDPNSSNDTEEEPFVL